MITLILAIVDAKYNAGFSVIYFGSVFLDAVIISEYFECRNVDNDTE